MKNSGMHLWIYVNALFALAFLWHVAPCGERRAVRILFAMFFSRGRENGRRCSFFEWSVGHRSDATITVKIQQMVVTVSEVISTMMKYQS